MGFQDLAWAFLLAVGVLCVLCGIFLETSSKKRVKPGDACSDGEPVEARGSEDGALLYHYTDVSRQQRDLSRVWDLLQRIGAVGSRFRFGDGKKPIVLSDGYRATGGAVLSRTRQALEYCGIVPDDVGPWVNDVFLFSGGVPITVILQRLQNRLWAMEAYVPPRKRAPPPLPSTYSALKEAFPQRVRLIQERWRKLVDPEFGPPDSRAGAIRSQFESRLRFLLDRKTGYDNVKAWATVPELERWLEELEDKRKTVPFKAASGGFGFVVARRNAATPR